MNARLTFIHALSPLHAGIGQGVGDIDLPIAREKATGLPLLPGSSLKGALRSRCLTLAEQQPDQQSYKMGTKIFGDSERNEEENRASQMHFSDQRLLLLPVRSLAGTFAWVTAPYVLYRLQRDLRDLQHSRPTDTIPQPASLTRCYAGPALLLKDLRETPMVYLEDLDLEPYGEQDAQVHQMTQWADWLGTHIFANDTIGQKLFRERFCVVHNDVFHFLLRTATEIIARIKLQENTKTVEDGGLWYEEALPTESILSGMAVATPLKEPGWKKEDNRDAYLKPATLFDVITTLITTPIQLGGKATVGRGLCRVHLVKGEVHAHA